MTNLILKGFIWFFFKNKISIKKIFYWYKTKTRRVQKLTWAVQFFDEQFRKRHGWVNFRKFNWLYIKNNRRCYGKLWKLLIWLKRDDRRRLNSVGNRNDYTEINIIKQYKLYKINTC